MRFLSVLNLSLTGIGPCPCPPKLCASLSTILIITSWKLSGHSVSIECCPPTDLDDLRFDAGGAHCCVLSWRHSVVLYCHRDIFVMIIHHVSALCFRRTIEQLGGKHNMVAHHEDTNHDGADIPHLVS